MTKKRKRRPTGSRTTRAGHSSRPRQPVERDAGRGSFSDNLIRFAVDQGVDITDAAELADFMDAYNSLSHDERVAVTDTGQLPDGATFDATPRGGRGSGAAFGLARSGRPVADRAPSGASRLRLVGGTDVEDDARYADPDDLRARYGDEDADLPEFLDGVPMPDLDEVWPTPENEASFLQDSQLVRWARTMVDWLGGGRPVTSTGALRRRETDEIAELLGIRTWSEPPRSMWDVLELSVVWAALVRSGVVELSATRSYPGLPLLHPSDSVESRAAAGRLFHASILDTYLHSHDGEIRAEAAPATVLALVAAAGPDGLHLPRPRSAAWWSDDWFVYLNFRELTRLGMLRRTEDTYRLPAVLVPVLTITMGMLAESFGVESLLPVDRP